jgi:uncharacterized protein
MNYYALIYHVVDGYVAKRAAFRDEHLELARRSAASGALQLGGALGDPPDRALLVFRGADGSVAEAFAQSDPYVLHGLVEKWEVLPWTVVVGEAFDAAKQSC